MLFLIGGRIIKGIYRQ